MLSAETVAEIAARMYASDPTDSFWLRFANEVVRAAESSQPVGPVEQEDERGRFEAFVKPHDAALQWLGDALGYESHFTHWMWKCWAESGRQARAAQPVPPAGGEPKC